MATVKTDGSQTATLTTEHTLATITDAATYVLNVDTANLADGEELTLRVYGKVRSGGTERLMYSHNVANAQAYNHWVSLPVATAIHVKYTLEQNGGTGRVYPWAVYEL